MGLTRLSLRRPVTLAMALATILLLGVVSITRLQLEFLPRVEFPFVGVFVPYENGIPSQVEREIVRPIEEVLATLGGVRETFSSSEPDQAFVGLEFDWGRDINMLRMEVKEKIDQVRGDLPDDVRQILLFTFNSNDIPIIEGRISAKGRDLSESWDLLEQKIVAPLQRIPGVGRVNIDGVLPTQASVYLQFDRILEYDVDVTRLFSDLAAANIELSVGRITDRGLRYDLRVVSGLSGAEDLEELPIDASGLRLKDVADVVYGAPGLSYGRFLNGEPAIAFWIQKASGYNTVEVCRAIEDELERINLDPTLQGISSFSFFNQADQITDGLRSLLQGGFIGSILAVMILYVFLRRIGMTLVIALAIPLSIMGTTIFLYLGGRSLNVLSMMGLMLGVGMLVDNAVVVLESIHRRQRAGAKPIDAAISGTQEVGRAIVASTLTTVIVFAPVIISKSDELAVWLGEVGLTISVTLIFSLLVSLTVIPILSVRLSGGRRPRLENGWMARVRKVYLRILGWTSLRHPYLTGIVIIPAVLVVTGVMMKVTDFKPDDSGDRGMRHERLYIDLVFSGPVDKNMSRRASNTVEDYLEAHREELGIRDIYSYYVADAGGVSVFFNSGVVSEKFYRDIRERLREELPVQAGVEYRFGNEEGEDSGVETFAVTVWGEDTEHLAVLSEEVKRRLKPLDGVSDLRSGADQGKHEIQVRVDSEKANRYGIRPATISQVLGLTYRGIQLPRLKTGDREIDLIVSLEPEDRESIENLALLTVGTAGEMPIRLGQVADFTFDRSPRRITRENQKTSVTVRGTYEGEHYSDVLDDVRGLMNSLQMPLGYGWDFGTEIRQAQQQNSEMGMNMLLAMACVFFVMASLFESLLHPLVVMGCVPFASLGVFWLMMATNTPFNLLAMIGMVILIGIVVNNGIVLIDHVNNKRREGLSLEDAIVAGCADRLRPILMTAGTTILGLMPLAVTSSAHIGDAQYYPMARAIIGGLASSTLLTLIVLPTYYRIATIWVHTLQQGWRRRRVRIPTAGVAG